MTEVQAMIF